MRSLREIRNGFKEVVTRQSTTTTVVVNDQTTIDHTPHRQQNPICCASGCKHHDSMLPFSFSKNLNEIHLRRSFFLLHDRRLPPLPPAPSHQHFDFTQEKRWPDSPTNPV
ncbi:hypothetical protein L1887_35850 [Cichorium endivia]|nr:hypothetical protein L1887_35850 [Cichorium endivia]